MGAECEYLLRTGYICTTAWLCLLQPPPKSRATTTCLAKQHKSLVTSVNPFLPQHKIYSILLSAAPQFHSHLPLTAEFPQIQMLCPRQLWSTPAVQTALCSGPALVLAVGLGVGSCSWLCYMTQRTDSLDPGLLSHQGRVGASPYCINVHHMPKSCAMRLENLHFKFISQIVVM